MKKSEIIALIEQTAIKYHKDSIAWYKFARNQEECTQELYMKTHNQIHERENAMCELLDAITGVSGHVVLFDERCDYEIAVL